MTEFLNFFEAMPAWQKLGWIVGCLWFSWSLEGFIPLVRFQYRKWKHAGVNFVFLATTVTINLLYGLLTLGVFNWVGNNSFGLLYLFDLPIGIELLIAVMVLDLIGQYWVHYLLHKYKWMWKFHMIHHSDSKVDVTTGTRHHPGDYFLRELFALLAIVLAGAPLAYYMVYRIVTIFFTYFTHANISVPYWLDKTISLVFISPNMHKFHHHFERPWTNTNYGNIFSFWDRIFNTFVYDDPRKIKYGLDVLDEKLDENIVYQFKIPFDKNIKTDY